MDYSNYNSPNEVDTTSTRLLRRVGENNSEAWKLFVSLYGPVVRYWIRGAGASLSDLPDVFSEVFLAVLKNIGSFERKEGKARFRAWLKIITVNKVNDHFRRMGKQPVAYGGSTAMMRIAGSEAPENALSGKEDADDPALAYSEDTFLTQRTLQLVKGEFRERTWLSFYRTAVDGQTSQEVAEELGITALAVRKAKSRVTKRLKEALGDVDHES